MNKEGNKKDINHHLGLMNLLSNCSFYLTYEHLLLYF